MRPFAVIFAGGTSGPCKIQVNATPYGEPFVLIIQAGMCNCCASAS